MPAKSNRRKVISIETRDYWNNLNINIDSFWDKWEDYFRDEFSRKLKKELDDSYLESIVNLYKLRNSNTANASTYDLLLNNIPIAIDLFCVMKFALTNPKAFARILNILPVGNKTNKKEVIFRCLSAHKKNKLYDLYIQFSSDKLGDNHFKFNLTGEIKSGDYQQFQELMRKSKQFLKRKDKHHKTVHLRHSYKSDDNWYFSFVKETSDDIINGVPNNKRIVRGQDFYVVLTLSSKALQIKTRSNEIAYNLRDYLATRGNNRLYFKHKSSSYNPSDFFKVVLQKNDLILKDDDGKEVCITDVGFRETNLNVELELHDSSEKHDIHDQIEILRSQGHLKLEDLSEFKYLTFSYIGVSYKVNIRMNKWGIYKLILSDTNKAKLGLSKFFKVFQDRFKIEFNSYLSNQNSTIDRSRIINILLNKKTIETINIPIEVEDEIKTLVKDHIIKKPVNCAKRRCENNKCRKITWVEDECPTCGNDLIIEGKHIDIEIDKSGIQKLFLKILKSKKRFKIKKYKKQVERKKYDLIEVLEGDKSITIYLCNGIPSPSLLNNFKRSASPLLIILTKFKESLKIPIIKEGFSCIDLASLYLKILDSKGNEFHKAISDCIQQQHDTWYQRILDKGIDSYNKASNRTDDYTDMDFETDTYNMFQELFVIGDRLGGKMTGVKAPDGIVVINSHNSTNSKYCFAWDCKYSSATNGYQLNDDKEKHRFYINTLNKNDKVKFYGGLKTYAIISQNMNLKAYEKFQKNLVTNFRWKGNVVFLTESILLKLYKFYKKNQTLVASNPEPFYKPVSELFSIIWKKDMIPFPQISNDRLVSIITRVNNGYEGKTKGFDFERGEFVD